VYVKIFNKEKLRALVKMQLTRNQPKTFKKQGSFENWSTLC